MKSNKQSRLCSGTNTVRTVPDAINKECSRHHHLPHDQATTTEEWHLHLGKRAEEKRRRENTRRMTRNW